MADSFFIVTSSEDGTCVDGPRTRESVAEMLATWRRETGSDRPVLDRIPSQDKGCFMGAPENAVLVLRGEIVSREEVTACPCGSGKAFAKCHGAEGAES